MCGCLSGISKCISTTLVCAACCCVCCCKERKRDVTVNVHPTGRRHKHRIPPPREQFLDLVKLIDMSRMELTPEALQVAIDTGEHAFGQRVTIRGVYGGKSGDATTAIMYELDDLLPITSASPDQKVVYVQTGGTIAPPNSLVVVFNVEGALEALMENGDFVIFAEAPGLHRGVRVHSGVVRLWQSIYEVLIEPICLWVKMNPTGSVTFTGHGVGGAVATLHTMFTQCSLLLGERMRHVTFGAVQSGNKRFKKEFKKLFRDGQSWRVLNDRDGAGHYGRLWGGRHVGQLVHMRRKKVCDKYWGRWTSMTKGADENDHDVRAYLLRIAQWDGRFLRIDSHK